MIQLIHYQLTFQGEDGNITHSAEGMALCEGDPDGESFKRCIASRHYRSGDLRVNYTMTVVEESDPKINKEFLKRA